VVSKSRSFRQSPRRYLVVLGLPTALTLIVLTRLGLWGLWVFPESQMEMRLALGYGPFLWGILLTAAVLWPVWRAKSIVYEITPTRLVQRCGNKILTMPLDKLYVNRGTEKILPRLRISDGRREVRVHAVFMPQYAEFANMLEAGSRIRRSEDIL